MDEVHGSCGAYPYNYLGVIVVNEYKLEWYHATLGMKPESHFELRRKMSPPGSSKSAAKGVTAFAQTRAKRKVVGKLRTTVAKKAARSTITTAVGTGVRVGGRVGLRFVPVVGWALLAYDVYTLGKYLLED